MHLRILEVVVELPSTVHLEDEAVALCIYRATSFSWMAIFLPTVRLVRREEVEEVVDLYLSTH
jgi:hypothetical protein